MGNLNDLLDCYSSKDLEDILRTCREAVPGTKAARIERVVALIRSGTIDFRADIIDCAYKDTLSKMCDAVGISSEGKVDELKRRLAKWFAENGDGRRGGEPSRARSSALDAPVSLSPSAEPAPASTNQPRPIESVSIAERQFIQVKMKSDSFLSVLRQGGRSFGETFLGATKLVPYTPGPNSKATFERGHPVDGAVYVLDPFSESQLHYLLAEEAARRIAEHKISALTVIAGCLGATRVEVVAVKTEGRTTNNKAEIDALGKQVGLDIAMSSGRSSTDRIGIEWDTSEVRPIPKQYMSYLDSMPDLRALADMVYAGRQPSNMHRQVTLDFRESQEISAKVSKISAVGSLAAKTGRQEFASSDWVFGIWFTRSATQTPAPGVPVYAPAASSRPLPTQAAHAYPPPPPPGAVPGAPCPTCHMPTSWIAQYQRWFCAQCQRYA